MIRVRVQHKSLRLEKILVGDDPTDLQEQAKSIASNWNVLFKCQEDAGQHLRLASQRVERQAESYALLIENANAPQSEYLWTQSLDNAAAFQEGLLKKLELNSPTFLSDYPQPIPSPPKLSPFVSRFQGQLDEITPKISHTGYLFPVDMNRVTSGGYVKYFNAHNEERERDLWENVEFIIQCASELNEYANTIGLVMEKFSTSWSSWKQGVSAYLRVIDANYCSGSESGIIEFFKIVIGNSLFQIKHQGEFSLGYDKTERVLLVDYQLPSPPDPSQGRKTTKKQNDLYDENLFQITLLTLHDIAKNDPADTVEFIVFNGYVNRARPETGEEQNLCILSVRTTKKILQELNLGKVVPKECFKYLKGVACSSLISLTPIVPLLKFNKDDRRFVHPREVLNSTAGRDNLAAMDWNDFEHLIREIFQAEFSSVGGEVKVTRASRDHGVDAVVFDPDPIRGGKTVIQAKRYTNTVGVAAVRDLYGTVINEGAGKGILVTTSDFGPDAYDFAAGKPLVLLNGGNLLHLLEKHGHPSRIDLEEAKRMLINKSKQLDLV